jgi:hypothetical protein
MGARGLAETNSGAPRERRAILRSEPLPGHKALVLWLETPVNWDAEFEADIDDVVRLIEAAAGPAAGR